MLHCTHLLIAFTLFIAGLNLISAGSNPESAAWLAENSKKEGVIRLPSGLQYKILKSGDGGSYPTADSLCLVHFEGTSIDGTVFDSTYNRNKPSTFSSEQVIKGWGQALQIMVEGDKWELYIPSDLAFGDKGNPPIIQPGEALIYTFEMLSIKGDKLPAAKCDPVSFTNCVDEDKEYIKKIGTKFSGKPDLIQEEIERVNRVAIQNPGASAKNKNWATRRVYILYQLLSANKEEL